MNGRLYKAQQIKTLLDKELSQLPLAQNKMINAMIRLESAFKGILRNYVLGLFTLNGVIKWSNNRYSAKK